MNKYLLASALAVSVAFGITVEQALEGDCVVVNAYDKGAYKVKRQCSEGKVEGAFHTARIEKALISKDLDFECACAAGDDCFVEVSNPYQKEVSTKKAPKNLTLQPGTFTGRECLPKICVEIYGISSMPKECQ